MNTSNTFTKVRRTVLGAAILIAASTVLSTTALAASPTEIKAKGKIVIGIQAANPPWGYVDATSGQADGFDADMGRAFAKELGVTAEFMGLEVANRIPSLTSARVDVLFATMAMLPDRAKAVQFSKPYVANSTHLVAAKTTDIKTPADMGKFVIGVPRASSMDTDIAKSAPASTTIRRFDNDAAAIQSLLSGQVQAVGGNMFYVKRLNDVKADTYENKLEFTKLFNGACTRLEDKDMNAALNTFIEKIKANGELAKIQQKWIGSSNLNFPTSIEGVSFVAK